MKNQRYVGVIVKCQNKVLLCKRNNVGSFPGMWSIPAGKIEENETTQEAARREFKEETAINIDKLDLEFVGIIPRHTRDGKKIKGLMFVYLLEVDDFLEPDLENAVDGEEHTDWGYFSANQVKSETSGEFLEKLIQIVLNKKNF